VRSQTLRINKISDLLENIDFVTRMMVVKGGNAHRRELILHGRSITGGKLEGCMLKTWGVTATTGLFSTHNFIKAADYSRA
jgi:hypothetical protein